MAQNYKPRARTDYIVVHCAATQPSQDNGAYDIDRWHRAQGWAEIGYHKVIRRDGTIEPGRVEHAAGAHVQGYNSNSVAVCLAGGVAEDGVTPEDNFTKEQALSLVVVLKEWQAKYPKAVIQGHRDFPGVKKACPSFDVKKWWAAVNKQGTPK